MSCDDQCVSRDELASTSGAAMVGMQRVPTANTRTIEAIIAEMGLSIADFGADGTGMDPVADTAAFIAAHDALPAEGGIIRFPDGIYRFNDNLVCTKRVRLLGNGCSVVAGGVARCQVYKGASVSGPLLQLTVLDSSIEDIGFEGESGNVGDGIHIMAGRSSLRRVSSHRMGQDGVRIGHSTQTNCNHFNHQQMFCRENGRHGYFVDDEFYRNNTSFGANCNNGYIGHVDATDNGTDGIRINGGWFNTIDTALVQTNGGDGIGIVATADLGARYTTIVAGEQDESNTGYNINNSGFHTRMVGVTPGLAAKLSDTGAATIILAPTLSKFDVLRVTNILTSDRPTVGAVNYPVVVRSYGNSGNGRGAGVEFQVPNGGGDSRVGGRQSVQQETVNIERWTWSVNISGVMTEVMEFSGQTLALRPFTNAAVALGAPAKQWTWGYFSSGVRVNNIQVVGAQGMAITDAAGGTEVATINAILVRLRAHGLIAT